MTRATSTCLTSTCATRLLLPTSGPSTGSRASRTQVPRILPRSELRCLASNSFLYSQFAVRWLSPEGWLSAYILASCTIMQGVLNSHSYCLEHLQNKAEFAGLRKRHADAFSRRLEVVGVKASVSCFAAILSPRSSITRDQLRRPTKKSSINGGLTCNGLGGPRCFNAGLIQAGETHQERPFIF